jgi:cell division septation protein DedD
VTPLGRLATCDPVLARRSRLGDRAAARRLAGRHLDRISQLATVISTSAEEAEVLARQGFSLALRGGRPFEDALVTAFGQLAAALPEADDARGRLAVLLAEVEERPVEDVARLLRLEPRTVDALLPRARASLGGAYPARSCRGWALASRKQGLTEAERQAGAAHLELCRRCRDRVAAVDRTRAQLLGGAGGMVGVAAVAQVVPWGGAAVAGAGTVLGTKATAGVIGAVGAAVLATGGTAAVVQQQEPHRPSVRQEAPVTTQAPAPRPSTSQAPASTAPQPPAPTPRPTPTTTTPATTPQNQPFL